MERPGWGDREGLGPGGRVTMALLGHSCLAAACRSRRWHACRRLGMSAIEAFGSEGYSYENPHRER